MLNAFASSATHITRCAPAAKPCGWWELTICGFLQMTYLPPCDPFPCTIPRFFSATTREGSAQPLGWASTLCFPDTPTAAKYGCLFSAPSIVRSQENASWRDGISLEKLRFTSAGELERWWCRCAWRARPRCLIALVDSLSRISLLLSSPRLRGEDDV